MSGTTPPTTDGLLQTADDLQTGLLVLESKVERAGIDLKRISGQIETLKEEILSAEGLDLGMRNFLMERIREIERAIQMASPGEPHTLFPIFAATQAMEVSLILGEPRESKRLVRSVRSLAVTAAMALGVAADATTLNLAPTSDLWGIVCHDIELPAIEPGQLPALPLGEVASHAGRSD